MSDLNGSVNRRDLMQVLAAGAAAASVAEPASAQPAHAYHIAAANADEGATKVLAFIKETRAGK